MFPVLKASAYVLFHTPGMVVEKGTTQTTERLVNKDSQYLKDIESHLRSYDDFVSYPPNQAYIGGISLEELENFEFPWFDKKVEGAKETAKMGSIYSEDMLILLMKVVDVFDLVLLEESFVNERLEKLNALHIADSFKKVSGTDTEKIEIAIKDRGAEAIHFAGKLVGCVNRAHDIDENLSAHVIYENLVVKASAVATFEQLISLNDIKPDEVDYVIECSEEACGDMNQRGGGNFAKSIAEVVGCVGATGSDTRGFCAAPTHALIQASALVKAGVYENVVVVAGGATAKLGMNGKDHVKKDLPILEDAVAGFAILVSKNDGVHPVIRTDIVGRHTVGTGSSPQAVMGSLIFESLDRNGLRISDVDKYSVEMQNPDITKPAGAGDVPNANYKMIAALAVMKKQIEKKDMQEFIKKISLPGWAPTQGHIPSGVPYCGFLIDDILSGKISRAMIVGKGSLFLGRMTNLFDGVSIVIEKNTGESDEGSVSKDEIKKMIAESMKEFANSLVK